MEVHVWHLQLAQIHFAAWPIVRRRLVQPLLEFTSRLFGRSDLGHSRAAYAQDVRNRVNPGAYAAIKDIPFAGLSHETTATQLALQWYEDKPTELESAREILLPSYGASVGAEFTSLLPYGEVVGRILGGGVGRIASEIKNRSDANRLR